MFILLLGDSMKITLGYACQSETLTKITTSSNYSYTNYEK